VSLSNRAPSVRLVGGRERTHLARLCQCLSEIPHSPDLLEWIPVGYKLCVLFSQFLHVGFCGCSSAGEEVDGTVEV
jgi:hypothetical protein